MRENRNRGVENRVIEERKRREGKGIPDQPSMEIIKGRYLEFKCKVILTLSPIYNHDLQGCHFSDVMIATASPVGTASYSELPVGDKIKTKYNSLIYNKLLIFWGQLLGLDFYDI